MNQALVEQVNEQARTWKMEEVSLGDRVLWYPGTEENIDRACVAIVTNFTKDYVELALLGKNQHLQLKKQVRHISDPRLALGGDWLNYGTWNAIPPSHADRSIQGRLRSLDGKVNSLNELRETHKEINAAQVKVLAEVDAVRKELLDLKKAIAKSAKETAAA